MNIPGFSNNKKIGLALGGGGARGYAHIGVLRALQENGIEFDFIAGTSAGSIVGSFIAAGMTYQQILKQIETFSLKEIKTSKIPLVPNKTENLEKVIARVLEYKGFDQLKTPFCAVAVDVRTGEEVYLNKGNLAKSVSASCAVPGVFEPVRIEPYLLVDGGLLNNIPSSVPKKFGCDAVVAVDINSTRGQGTKSDKYIDVILASVGIMMKTSAIKGYMNADVMITPNMKRFKSTKIIDPQDMIEEGYRATMLKMHEIKKLFGYRTKYNKVGIVDKPSITFKNKMII